MTDALLRNAQDAYKVGNLAEAARLYQDVLRTEPERFDALSALGLIYFRRNQFELAQALLADALKVSPGFLEGFCFRGAALANLKRYDEALACFDQALAVNPDSIMVLSNRATVLLQMNRHEAGLAELDRVLAIDPARANSWYNRGNALMALGRHEEALASFDRALAIPPQRAQFWIGRGRVLATLARREESLSCFEKALAIEPNNVLALEASSMLLFGLKRYQNAADGFEALLRADPGCKYAQGYLFQSRLYCCDWRDFEQTAQMFASDLVAGRATIIPMALTNFSRSAGDQLQCARLWTAREFPASDKPLWNGELYRHDKIRVAYLSPEFAGNPVATQLMGVLESHDKNRFETSGIAFGHDEGSPMRLRAERSFDKFIDVRGKRDSEAAAILRDLEIDIAVDLAGHTGNCRTGVLALRPAPAQVNYLGFPGSMGAPYIDYIIVDQTVIPEHLRHHYSEKIVWVPHTYMPVDGTRRIAPAALSRADAGLPKSGFVFCSFNNNFKISPDVFDVWMRLLREIERSVLWLPQYNSSATQNLRLEAEKRDVESSRLVFAPFLDSDADHLARLRLADLFLDTFPYNAHSTACDALSAGLPVLTCTGETFASRVAASVLNAIGAPELVARTLAEYQSLALALARDPVALDGTRNKLRTNRNTFPLFDTARYTRALETAYLEIWRKCQRGEPPGDILITRDIAA
jgi:predicted O-linked N-acetylglucosamine transferase (SPINDLY family)